MKYINLTLLIMILASITLISCEDEKEWDCDSCSTKIVEKKRSLGNTSLNSSSSLRFTTFLYKYNNQWIVVNEASGCFSTDRSYYYVCNPSKIKSLLKTEENLRVEVIGNVREKKEEEQEIDNCDYCNNQQTFDIEVLNIKIVK